MSSMLVSAGSLLLGFVYLYFHYETAIGWFQIVLGAVCVALTALMMAKDRQVKKAGEGKEKG